MRNNIILGAGMAGLGASLASNFEVPIYEQNDYAGGLCHSFNIKGFTFDNAVHLSFSKNEFVMGLFDKTEQFTYHPYPTNWYHDRWIKQPVQNNLFALDVNERTRAVVDFVNKPKNNSLDNFSQWTYSQFGKYISENFSLQYNKKYWCDYLEKIGTYWIGSRLYQPSLEEVIYGSFTEETANTYYAPEMRYPKNGGYNSYINELINKLQINYNKKVVKIDSHTNTIRFYDNTNVQYEKAYSSIPIISLIKMLEDVPKDILEAANKLNHTSVALVSVGFNKPNITDKIWFYIYDEDILAARVYSPSNKSENNVPKCCSSLQFEIYFNGKDDAPSKKECIDNTIYALKKMNIANEDDIVFMDFKLQQYANVIMYKNNLENADIVKNYLVSKDIIPIGRFGEWDYLWSDQAFMSGYNSVKEH